VTNGVLAWAPTEAQGPSTNTVRVSVSDGVAMVTNSFTVVVREVNALPTLAGGTNATINELAGYTQALGPRDGDVPAQPLSVALVSGPTGLVVTNGVLAWTPTEAQGPSTNTVRVSVSDGIAMVTNSLTLVVREVNALPTLAGATNATTYVGATFIQSLGLADADLPAQVLTAALVQGPAGAALSGGALTWTPTAAQAFTTNTVRVSVSDGVGFVTNTFTVIVRGTNVPPRFAGATNTTINEMAGYTQALGAQDVDVPAQALSVALVSGPTGLVVTNGVLAWTPTEAQGPSTNTVRVSVGDGIATVTNSFTVVVRELNALPTLAGATNATLTALVAHTQSLGPGDVDIPVQSLVVNLLNGPSGLVVTNAVLAWTPTATQAPSTNLVLVTISDGTAMVTNRFTLTVRAAGSGSGAVLQSVQARPGPHLKVVMEGESVVLEWEGEAGWRLEASRTLESPRWERWEGPVVVEGGRCAVRVKVDPAAAFWRLSQ